MSVREKSLKLKGYLQVTLLIFVFVVGVAPIFLSYTSSSSQTYSIYSTAYDGLSVFRQSLESVKTGSGLPQYKTENLVSNLNALNRVNKSGVLMVIGPSASYDDTEFMSLLLFLLRGGSLVIADDFGSGNQILEPLFKAFESYDATAKLVNSQTNAFGFKMPTFSEMLANFTGSNPQQAQTEKSFLSGKVPGGGSIPGVDVSGGSSSIADGIFKLIGTVIKRFGFNRSVLMDVGSNNQNPNRPLIVNIDKTNTPFSITQNVNKIQTEMASIISIQLNVSKTITDSNGVTKTVHELVWQPLSQLSLSQVSGSQSSSSLNIFSQLDFLFPLYSSKQSWIETNIKAAADNTAKPNPTEWGNNAFSLALNLPIFPGGGKIIFIADPSIFINRWTSQIHENDNLIFAKNVVKSAASNLLSNGTVPVYFDFGHTYQSITSPALYTTSFLKLLANFSMFPLLAPFVPLTAYSLGKIVVPKSKRLKPILLTKRRGERGVSTFDKELEEIKESGAYGQPIKDLTRRLLTRVEKDVRFTELTPKNLNYLTSFFVETFPDQINKKEFTQNMGRILRVYEKPTVRLNVLQAKSMLLYLKKMLSLLEI